jgi:hypothetical protein
MKRILPIAFLLYCSLVGSTAQRMTLRTHTQRQSQDPDQAKRDKDRMKALNKERNKAIKEDTDKLLELATELKKSVDASVEGDTLSLDVIRKTDDIEKLAKKVRGKMKETYDSPDNSIHLPDATSR